MASWSKKQVIDFIEIYRSYECLWRVKSPDYSNRLLKDQAYQHMADWVAQFEPLANRDFITKKINSLRTTFRKELRKVERYGEDTYRPKLWYFDHLLFVKDEQEGTPEFSWPNVHVKSERLVNETVGVGVSTQDSWLEYDECLSITEPDTNQHTDSDADDTFDQPDSTPLEPTPKRPKVERTPTTDHDIPRTRPKLHGHRSNDYFDIIGQGISNKLRRLGHTQRIFAERLIHEVIFEAEMENLHRGVSLKGFSEEDNDV